MRARLLLLFYIYTVKAQNTVVVQSPELVKVEDGGSVRLQCSTNVVGTYCYRVIWTRIDSRTKKLIFLQNIDTGGQKKDCFFGINSATLDDSGTYYCSVVLGTMIYFGNGSTVIVTQGNRTEPPPVDILWPRSIQPIIPLLCVVSGVAPSQVRVFWVIDGEEDSGLIQSLWTKDSDEIVESTQNQVLVRADEWERGVVCTCVVEFDGKNISKSVQNEESSDVCTVLLYGAFAGAGLTIIVAISIAVVLHRGRSVRSDGDAREQRRSAGTEHRHRSGRQGSGLAIDRTISEVQYASLEEASLARRAYVPTV
ncbi:hypothetical protein SKAU_G00408590 [Synaphobranchus kaupii]|uniref:Ig-like domain-containing protein n=1 Tax=Synaphobranchus kaupii TaxID=118154 RepID=A0A9Q1IC99_SYNKA|nr:hypothetical protein SKAU_G00408590 [Synaphobranchus kaupii]